MLALDDALGATWVEFHKLGSALEQRDHAHVVLSANGALDALQVAREVLWAQAATAQHETAGLHAHRSALRDAAHILGILLARAIEQVDAPANLELLHELQTELDTGPIKPDRSATTSTTVDDEKSLRNGDPYL